jgi:hypothetical protein
MEMKLKMNNGADMKTERFVRVIYNSLDVDGIADFNHFEDYSYIVEDMIKAIKRFNIKSIKRILQVTGVYTNESTENKNIRTLNTGFFNFIKEHGMDDDTIILVEVYPCCGFGLLSVALSLEAQGFFNIKAISEFSQAIPYVYVNKASMELYKKFVLGL